MKAYWAMTLWWRWDRETGACRRAESPEEIALAREEFEIGEATLVGYASTRTTEVSTAFLGIDHGHARTPLPLLFETKVWERNREGKRGRELEEIRCTTMAEACDIHKSKVDEFLGLLIDPGWGPIPRKVYCFGSSSEEPTDVDAGAEIERLGEALQEIRKG